MQGSRAEAISRRLGLDSGDASLPADQRDQRGANNEARGVLHLVAGPLADPTPPASLAAFVRASGFDLRLERADDLHMAPQWSAPVLILYPNPPDRIARALAGGAMPAEALAAWRHDAETLLAVHRRARRRITLLLADEAADPALAIPLAARLGLPPPARAEPAPARETGGVTHLLARVLLESDPAAAQLWAELRAATLAIAPPAPHGIDAALAEHLSLTAALIEAESALASERRATEAAEARRQAAEDERRRTGKHALTREASAARRLREMADAHAAARELLEAHIAGQQAVIAGLHATARTERTACEARIAALHESTSWRITAPLRRLRRWMQRLRARPLALRRSDG